MSNLDSLFGGGLALPSSGVLGPEDQKQLRNAALVKAGLATAGGTGGLFPALSQGLQAGQESYQGGVKDMLASQQLQQNMYSTAMKNAQQGQLLKARRELFARFPMPDSSDPNRLRDWIDNVTPTLIQNGDMEVLGKMAEVRKSLNPKETPAPHSSTNISGADPTLRAAFPTVDPKKVYSVELDHQGKIVGTPLEQAVPPGTAATINLKENMTPVQLQRLKGGILTSYDTELNQMHTAGAIDAWSQVKNVLDRSRAGTQTADDFMTLVDGILKLNNPGAVIRSGTLNIAMSKIGDLPEKIQRNIRLAYAHGWPPALVESIGVSAKSIADAHQAQAADARDRAIKRGIDAGVTQPEMERALRDPWKIANPVAAPVAVAPRLPGENPAAYLKRTEGK
jgi:hypothetical protein